MFKIFQWKSEIIIQMSEGECQGFSEGTTLINTSPGWQAFKFPWLFFNITNLDLNFVFHCSIVQYFHNRFSSCR